MRLLVPPLLLLAILPALVVSLNTVLYGPSARELLLLTAKLAAREGLDASCICAPGTEDGCRRLMYGIDYLERTKGGDGEEDLANHAKPVSTGEDIEAALQRAHSLLLIGYDAPMDGKSYRTLLDAAGNDLSKVVLMSKMGVTRAKGGFFGGGVDAKVFESETILREICRSKGLPLSIIRAGTVKGGGPGDEGCDFGLDKCYYDTLLDLSEASVTMAHDKFTLGLDCRNGDPEDMPNVFAQMGSKSSFEACKTDTNRIVVAGAVVAAALHEKPVEVSIGAEKAARPPSRKDWEEAFARI